MDLHRLRFPDLPEPAPRRLPAALREPHRIANLAGLLPMVVGDLEPQRRLSVPYRGLLWVSTSALVLLAIFVGLVSAYVGAVGAARFARSTRHP